MVWWTLARVKENDKSWKGDKGGLQFQIEGPGKVLLWTDSGKVLEVGRRASAKALRWELSWCLRNREEVFGIRKLTEDQVQGHCKAMMILLAVNQEGLEKRRVMDFNRIILNAENRLKRGFSKTDQEMSRDNGDSISTCLNE